MTAKTLLPIIVTTALTAAAAAEDYELPPNEEALWGYASALFDLTRAYGIVSEKTEEEILELLPETMDLLERFNADLSFWIDDLTDRGVLDQPGSVYEALNHLLHSVQEKVSTTIAVFFDADYERGAYFIAALRRNCESLTEYFHELDY
jgi:hypothetical protein